MKIVQSFWSGQKNLLENSFGWLSPQYHIMAWTLSCLKLKEHYDALHLYTDTNGYNILIDNLGLPYQNVSVCYDAINDRHKNLWALPKIMTYACQNQPFIHVDGDVFVWERFGAKLESAGLISQNLEAGTAYYKQLMDDVKRNLKDMPQFIAQELDKQAIGSYNAGIMGGSDLSFIKKYTDEALKLVNDNYPTGSEHTPSVNFNILFEQILFYCLCKQDGKKVNTLFAKTYSDLGYTTNDFADFTSVPYKLKYLHVIGAKKRELPICEMISRILLREYPDYFYKIVALFKNQHAFFYSKTSSAVISELHDKADKPVPTPAHNGMTTEEEVITIDEKALHEQKLIVLKTKWEGLSHQVLLDMELACTNYHSFFFKTMEQQLETKLERNPYLEAIEESFNWSDEIKKEINPDMVSKENESLGIVYIPRLFFKGYNKVVIDDLDFNLLTLLDDPISLRDILLQVAGFFEMTDGLKDSNKVIYDLVLLKLRGLFLNQCVYVSAI
jgi:hypothetical protein